jgi:hypothetical protein
VYELNTDAAFFFLIESLRNVMALVARIFGRHKIYLQ